MAGAGVREEAMKRKHQVIAASAGFLAVLVSVGGTYAAEPCGLCDEKIVTNSVLAQCFLDEYPFLSGKASGAIVVDLSKCEQERSIVPPLAAPGQEVVEPSLTFMLTKPQLDCLKTKLERKDIELDPSATIDLDGCQ
jgi:hypothetical protein